MSDILNRLRSWPASDGTGDALAAHFVAALLQDAANEIASLREAVKNENEACANIADIYKDKAAMRARIYQRDGNEQARESALDKLEAAVEIGLAIRERAKGEWNTKGWSHHCKSKGGSQ